LAWADFDRLARGAADARLVGELRSAERSRRLLLIRAIVDAAAKDPELAAPLPPAADAWELLARAQHIAPTALDLVLAHPYTGSWAGYTTRLLDRRISGIGPLWAHVGHVHAVAAAAALRARISFDTAVPVWSGYVALPTLGTVRVPAAAPWTTARVRAGSGVVEVVTEAGTVRLPTDLAVPTAHWWPVRRIVARDGETEFAVVLDDVDPYRGPYEPMLPRRVADTEVVAWRGLLSGAWQLIRRSRPDLADAMRAGFDSVVPHPPVEFRTPSASSDDSFGSAVIARPKTPAALAAILVHEFHHSLLGGLLRLVRLSESDTRQRCYAAWRDDPRPVGGMVQGLFAFYGVTGLWRGLGTDRLARFEFEYHRRMSWQALTALRPDPALTEAGRRFVDRIAEVLQPWQHEPVPADITELSARAVRDHYLGWRMRYVRPDPDVVERIATAWVAGDPSPPVPGDDPPPRSIPDGTWSHARADLCRVLLAGASPAPELLDTVPNATSADLAMATGRFEDAARGYRAALSTDPDRPASWVGLGLALAALATSPAGRMLTYRPELVRAVHRAIRDRTTEPPAPERLAAWLDSAVR
jgi:HEXXH motif-containing protein